MVKIKKLPSGNWNAVVYAGKDANGKRMFQSITDRDKKEVEYQAALVAHKRKHDAIPENCTVEKALNDYIAERSNIISPSTIEVYKRHARSYTGGLASLKVSELTQSQLQSHINKMAESLGYKTIKNYLGLLAPAIKAKNKDFTIEVTLPQKTKKELKCPTEEDMVKILEASYGTELFKAIIIAMCIGDRRSQVCGLEYGDIDKKNNSLTIRRAIVLDDKRNVIEKGSKSFAGDRTVEVPPELIAMLGDGAPKEKVIKMSLGMVSDRFRYLMDKLGMPYTFHGLRHFNASAMLALGIPNKYAQERGGWATDNMLKNVYQHTMDKKRIEVDQKCNTYFSSLLNTVEKKKDADNDKHSFL